LSDSNIINFYNDLNNVFDTINYKTIVKYRIHTIITTFEYIKYTQKINETNEYYKMIINNNVSKKSKGKIEISNIEYQKTKKSK